MQNVIVEIVLLMIGILILFGASEVFLNYIEKKNIFMICVALVIIALLLGMKFAITEAVIVGGRWLYRNHKGKVH